MDTKTVVECDKVNCKFNKDKICSCDNLSVGGDEYDFWCNNLKYKEGYCRFGEGKEVITFPTSEAVLIEKLK